MSFPRFATIALVFGFISPPAHADFWSDAVGILTDPLKIGEGTENLLHAVERAFIHAERLQGEVDEDIRDYLTQIDTTVSDTRDWFSTEREATLEQIERTVSDSLTRVAALEKAFIADTRDLVKCSGEVTARSLRVLLADSLNDLGQRKPRFEVFGVRIGEIKIDAADIPSPISGFRQTKALYEQAISEVTEDDPPSAITDAYAEIQRLADLARCHYKNDTTVYEELYLIELEYNRRGRSWLGRINPI